MKISQDIRDAAKADEAEMALMSSSRFLTLPPEMLAGLHHPDDEVPPKAAFQILDREKPEALNQLPPVDLVPEALATATESAHRSAATCSIAS